MKNNLKIFVFLTVVTGVVYPLSLTLMGKIFFPDQVGGSLVKLNNQVVGSKLLAQEFKSEKYFHPRPSAIEYNPLNSGASNLGPISKKLKSQIEEAKKRGDANEMIFNSGSGLDPHISPSSAIAQVERVGSARGYNLEKKKKLIVLIENSTIHDRQIIFGTDLINVLELNLLLDNGKI